MAETYLFLTKKDFKPLVEFIINEFKAEFWIQRCFDKPNGICFTTYQQIEDFIYKHKDTFINVNSFFILSDRWSSEPLYYSLIEPTDKTYRPFYSLRQQYGGPSIQLTPSYNGILLEHKDKIIGGTLSDYSHYISGSFLTDKANGFRTIDRPQELTNAMKIIKRFIKTNGKKVVYRNGKFVQTGLAMNHSIEEYNKGVQLLMGEQKFAPE
jgi:hypothetical protein